MIELIPSKFDDGDFLGLVQRIATGAIATLHVREVYLVHINNWFDWKWLGWRSRGERGPGSRGEFTLAPFHHGSPAARRDSSHARRRFAGGFVVLQ